MSNPPKPPAPLAGLRVVEVSHDVAASFCAKVLADLGADVVMLEPPSGHALRGAPPRRDDGVSGRFLYLAAGKQCVIAENDADVQAQTAAADIVVTDHHPDDVDQFVDGNRIVVCIRPFGSTGPNADHKAHHLTLFHSAGESSTLPSGLSFELYPERPPIQIGSDIAWFDTGWNAAAAVLAACVDRQRGGPAQRIDVSAQESELTVNRTRLSRWLNDGVLAGREKNRFGITGMLRCRDGWAEAIGMHQDPWDRLAELPEGAVFRDTGFANAEARMADEAGFGKVLHEWCAERTKVEVAGILARVGVPAGFFADPADLLASSQLAHREFFREAGGVTVPGMPYRLTAAPVPGDSRPLPGGRMLDGVRVLDFTWAAAGPYGALLLSVLGADVIKVESTRRLDPARRGFVTHYEGIDRSPIYNELNLNKRSFQVDLTQPEGVALVHQLAGWADVVVDNFRPGVMDRFGLSADALLAEHPHLVVASSSAHGSTGPDAMGAGLASIFAATGGLSSQIGYADGPPVEVSDPMDYRSGTVLAVGILAGLIHRARTGAGLHVDLSSNEVAITSAPDALLAHALGVPWEPRRGNGHPTMSPHDVYGCADDGWVAVAIGDDEERAALSSVLGDTDLVEWAATRSARDAAATLLNAGVAASPVLTFADLADDPHLAARNVFVEVEHPLLGRQRVMRAPWLFSDWGSGVDRPGPLMGADNESVLAELAEVPEMDDERRSEVFR